MGTALQVLRRQLLPRALLLQFLPRTLRVRTLCTALQASLLLLQLLPKLLLLHPCSPAALQLWFHFRVLRAQFLAGVLLLSSLRTRRVLLRGYHRIIPITLRSWPSSWLQVLPC